LEVVEETLAEKREVGIYGEPGEAEAGEAVQESMHLRERFKEEMGMRGGWLESEWLPDKRACAR
jgi:hypothetical protein